MWILTRKFMGYTDNVEGRATDADPIRLKSEDYSFTGQWNGFSWK